MQVAPWEGPAACSTAQCVMPGSPGRLCYSAITTLSMFVKTCSF